MTGNDSSVGGTYRSPESTIPSEQLPIATHTLVLGVDIAVHAQAMHAEVYEGGHRGGLSPDIEIEAWTGDRYSGHPDIRRELAFWARRNLFDGAGPR